MNDYYSLRVNVTPCTEDATDYLASLLGDIGYETFVPDSTGLTAYVKAEDFDEKSISEALDGFPWDTQWEAELIPGQDWNEEWEKNYFQPIVVDNGSGEGVVIHSTFHTDVPAAKYDIVIDPKMAFGTGHHATTAQIIAQLLEMPLHGKSVIDMGTGTGILAFLAMMRGAAKATGIEIDPCAYENAVENAKLNGCEAVTLINGCADNLGKAEPADLFIANINRNIVIADLPAYAKAIKPGGALILSGFYDYDIPAVWGAAQPLGFEFVKATALASDGEIGSRSQIDSIDGITAKPANAEPECQLGTYGAVNPAAPDSEWACLILRKKQ